MDAKQERTHHCRTFASCNSTFVVYRLDWECGCFYISCTKRKLKERFAEHRYAIRTENLDYPMSKHFRTMGHINTNNLKVVVVETVQMKRETIIGLTISYPGLKEEMDLSPFLHDIFNIILWVLAISLLFLWALNAFWHS